LVNTLPVVACVGFMGLAGINLDLGSSIVMAVALGLVVDDTGHLIMRYKKYRQSGSDPREAIDLTLRAHWSPVITATLVICIGFSVLNFAPLVPFHSFSRTLSATMAFAVLGDLVLMPPLLIHFDRSKPRRVKA
jgi:predicted RND superfamily exporter protein